MFVRHAPVAPQVTGVKLNTAVDRSRATGLSFTFSADVSGSLSTADLVLRNTATGQTIAPAALALAYDTAANRATFSFSGLNGGILPNGRYTATLTASGITDIDGRPLAAGYAVSFAVNPTITGTPGNDRYIVRLAPDGDIQVFSGATATGTPIFDAPMDLYTTLRFAAGAGNDTITLDASNGPLPTGLTFDLGAGNNTLRLEGGACTLSTAILPSSAATSLILRNSAAVTFASTIPLAGLDIGPGSIATLARGFKCLSTSGLTLDPTACLDLSDGFLILRANAATRNAALSYVAGRIRSAYTPGAGPHWTAPGITSSVARADTTGRTALGYALNNSGPVRYSTFGSQKVDANCILIRYTYAGDANLDGAVTTADAAALWPNYGGHARTWSQGDFNYDTLVNMLDMNVLRSNLGRSIRPA